MGSRIQYRRRAGIKGLIRKVIGIAAFATFFYLGCGDGIVGGGDNTKNPKDTTTNPTVPTPTKAIFKDNRDGQSYQKVTIGIQTWMSENLNYDIPDDTTDVCYRDSADYCVKYGRFYSWGAAMNACPAGWHLPDTAEWHLLINQVGGIEAAATKLKATSGWRNDGNGTNDFGFSALPGGCCGSNGAGAGDFGYWWTATEYNDSTAWDMSMNGFAFGVYYPKRYLYSVRCVLD